MWGRLDGRYKYMKKVCTGVRPMHRKMVPLKIGCKAELHSLYKSLKEGRRGQGLILVLNEVV